MRSSLEILTFLILASGIHLMMWGHEEEGSLQSAGASGEHLVSVLASNASMQQLVQQWETPPATPTVETQPVLNTPQTPIPPAEQPTAPQPVTDVPQAVPEMPRMADAPALPSITDTAPPPPPPPAPEKPPEKPVEKPTPKKVAKAPSKASQAQVARKAKGEGNKGAAGNNGVETTASQPSKKAASLMRKWGSTIRTRIARRAPRGAGRGTAIVRVTVASSGQLMSVSLAKSSGNAKIDNLALQAVRRAAPFPKAPAGIGKSSQTFSIPIKSK